jgi:hypothetical protein
MDVGLETIGTKYFLLYSLDTSKLEYTASIEFFQKTYLGFTPTINIRFPFASFLE